MIAWRWWRTACAVVVATGVLAGCASSGGDRGVPATGQGSIPSQETATGGDAHSGGGSATVLVLDGSGTMSRRDVAPSRLAAAKTASAELIRSLPEESRLAVMAFGQSTGNTDAEKPRGCQDVKTLMPAGAVSAATRGQALSAIETVKASGYTPIGLAISRAAALLSGQEGSIVLVTDGEDTCAPPDPCQIARQLKQDHPKLTISTVGMRVGGSAAEQLSCIASATGGVFVTADDTEQLTRRLAATRDVDAARSVLTSTGLGSVQLGMTFEQVKKAEGDFPDWADARRYAGSGIPGQDLLVIVWRDCSYVFNAKRALVGIQPEKVSTIDKVSVGDSVSSAKAAYGPPISSQRHDNGSRTEVYRADSTAGTAYRITSTTEGKITIIVLCRCLPTQDGRGAAQLVGTRWFGTMLRLGEAELRLLKGGRFVLDRPYGPGTGAWTLVGDVLTLEEEVKPGYRLVGKIVGETYSGTFRYIGEPGEEPGEMEFLLQQVRACGVSKDMRAALARASIPWSDEPGISATCSGDFALLTASGPGDTSLMLLKQSGKWNFFTGFPSTTCQQEYDRLGGPQVFRDHFPYCS